LEFLMTYGWAILVVFVVIGTLAYFGVLNPSALMPEKCTLQMGLYCKDHRIDGDNSRVVLKLENGMGRSLIITRIKVGEVGELVHCDVGIGSYTGLIQIDGCNSTACSKCNMSEDAKDNYYECNTDAGGIFANKFNNHIGWMIPISTQGNIIMDCDIYQAEGKTKVDLALVYFFDDSGPEFKHTMKGELLAKIETIEI